MWFVWAVACGDGSTAEGIQIGATTSFGPRGRVRVLSGAAAAAGRTEAIGSYVGGYDEALCCAVVLGDADGDGVDDLVLSLGDTERFGSGASLGGSDPFDWPQVLRGAHAAFPVGDVDGDGVTDVVTGDGIYSGAGLLADAPPLATLALDSEVVLLGLVGAGDTNGDGAGDLIVHRRHLATSFTATEDLDDSAVYFGPFGGELHTGAGDVSLPGAAVGVGDLDADGTADLATLVPGTYHGLMSTDVLVFTGSSLAPGAALGPEDATWTVVGDAPHPEDVRVFGGGDGDGDGHDELWVTFNGTGDLLRTDVFSGADLERGRTFGAADLLFPFYMRPTRATADLDGDGAPDMALGRFSDGWKVAVYLDPALGGSAAPDPDGLIPCSPSPLSLPMGDVDGDGVDDLLVVEESY